MKPNYVPAHYIRNPTLYKPCKPGDPRWFWLMWLDAEPYDEYEPWLLVKLRALTEPKRCAE
jgi:hypothetical protein